MPEAVGYSGKLDNSGERITLLGPLGETIEDFTYDDESPWPLAADGNGSSLEIIDPLGDPADPASWRASYFADGSPGTDGLPLLASNGTVLPQAAPAISVELSKSILLSTLGSSDLQVNSAAGGPVIVPTDVQWDSVTKKLLFQLPSLADGNFTATLSAGSISATDGTPLSEYTFDFFVLAADANHDRSVNTVDFTAMAMNFNKEGASYSDGDFNSDGKVNALDFNILATQFGTAVAAPADGVPASRASILPAASVPPSLFGNPPVSLQDPILQ
jgi:hypothetical protein